MSVIFKESHSINLDETEAVFDLCFHPNKPNILGAATVEGDILILDVNNHTKPVTLTLDKHHKGVPIRKLRFASEDLLVTAAKTIKLFDLNCEKVTRKISRNGSKIYSLLVVDNFLLCAGDDEGNFSVWDYRVNRGIHMDVKECDGFISDLDIDPSKRLIVATSGEGTLSAFNIRAKRLEPPQSELFDAGFLSVCWMEEKNKVIVGAEDGAINFFNKNEWGNISTRYPLPSEGTRSSGSCSIDSIEMVNDSCVAVATSDGKVRAVSILPNSVLCNITDHESSVEALAVNQDSQMVASVDTNIIKLNNYEMNTNPIKEDKQPDNEFFSDLI